MMEPRRLLEEDATDVERMLLDCAAHERPEPALEAKMLVGLSAAGLAGVAAHGAAAAEASAAGVGQGTSALAASEVAAMGEATAASSGLWGGIIKWGVGVFVAGALFGVGKAWLDASSDGGEQSPSSLSATPQQQASGVSKADAALADEEKAASAEDAVTAPSQPDSSGSRGLHRKPTSAQTDAPAKKTTPPDQSGTSALRAEVAALDRVRAALAQQKPEEALSLIQRYRTRFPTGALEQEATVLEVRALEARGHRDQAENLTRDFLQEHPDTLHRKQLEADEQTR